MKIKVQISKKKTIDLTVPSINTTVSELKKFFEKERHVNIYRQSFKLLKEGHTGEDRAKDWERLTDDKKKIGEYGVKAGSLLQFKDLGPQIGYRTVFIWEYLGPILIMLAYAMKPSFVYGDSNYEFGEVQQMAIYAFIAHFLKREFETLFIHRFSRPTMPLMNLFKNSIYYWSFAAFIGYPLCHPKFTAPGETQVYVGLGIFIVSELGNLITHIMLRNLRPAEGSQQRPIPKGFLFNFVACPNYTFEVAGWIGFSIMCQTFWSYMFTLVGFLQMWQWAVKKHRGYIKTYGTQYKKLRRKTIVPFLF